MRKFRALFIVNLKAALSSFRFGGRKRKRAASGAGALVLLAVLALYLSGVYSFTLVVQLAPIGMAHLVVLLMAVLATAMGTLFTALAAQGVVFGGKDNDLMLSLPVSPFSLMLCRTLALYLENLVFGVFIMLPAGAAYMLGGGGGGPAFFPVLLLCTALLALLPTLLSLILGFVLAWLTGRFSRRAGVGTVLYLAAFLVVMALAMRLSFAMNDVAAYAAGLQDAFSGWGLPFVLVMEASCGGDLLALLRLALLCVLPFLLAVWLFGTRYKKIVTGLAARGARSDYRLGRVKATGCRAALLKKEFRRFFGTPIYFMNNGVGLIMLVVAGVAAVFFRGSIAAALGELEAEAGIALPILPILTLTACFLAAMAPTTAICISLEGKQLWILKAAPIPARGIFAVKVGFQLLLEVPCLLVSTLCLAFAFSLTAGEALLMLAAELSIGLCMALLGLFVNLCMPRLDAPNDTIVVKQSGSVMVTMLSAFVLVAAGAGLYVLTAGALGTALALLPPAALFLALSAAFYAILAAKGEKMFIEL